MNEIYRDWDGPDFSIIRALSDEWLKHAPPGKWETVQIRPISNVMAVSGRQLPLEVTIARDFPDMQLFGPTKSRFN